MTTTSRRAPWLVGIAKIAAAGATITATAFAIVAFGDSEGKVAVPEAKADIGWFFSAGPDSKQRGFTDSLESLGMEEPRAYDWNGNQMFFSSMATSESPKQVLRRFQDSFVEHGVNSRPYYGARQQHIQRPDVSDRSPEEQARVAKIATNALGRADDVFTGGVVPFAVTDDMVQMAGTASPGKAKDGVEWLNEMASTKKNFHEMLGEMRYVDAFREGDHTRVTATWSDDSLDMRRFAAPDQRKNDIVSAEDSMEVPLCLGCQRKTRFAGLSKGEEGYTTNIFESPQPATATLDFYDKVLSNRGWRRSDATNTVLSAKRKGLIPMGGGQLLHYARGEAFVTLIAYEKDQGGSMLEVLGSP